MIDNLLASLIDVLTRLVIAAVPVVLAITMPEATRGYVASRHGDSIARAYRRLTFNPLPHIDPIGTLAVPFGFFVFATITGSPLMLLGWPKVLPLSDSRLRRPRIAIRWVAGSAIAANAVMMLAWGAVWGLTAGFSDGVVLRVLHQMAMFGMQVNAVFTAFQMLPVPPLPGGKIALTLLDYRQGEALQRLEPYAFVIVIVLALSGVLSLLISPLMWLATLVGSLASLL
jgi:Zn-dependent protease